ncbi:MAG: hypothetical protein ACTHMJ_02770, partial [Thermomicrobiales bacterium]
MVGVMLTGWRKANRKRSRLNYSSLVVRSSSLVTRHSSLITRYWPFAPLLALALALRVLVIPTARTVSVAPLV